MEKINFSLLFFFILSSSFAQMNNGKYGNEWINYDQTYIKVKVAEDGIFRLSAQTLAQNGVPSNVKGNQYQLFYLGEEVPIHTSTPQVFSNDDYLEFYGQKNRSAFDRFLFADPDAHMLNPEYSLYTDTSAYFLTWSSSTNNERYNLVTNNLNNVPAKEEYYMHDELLVFSDTHVKRKTGSAGNSPSHFDLAEGFSTGFPNERIHLSTIEPVNIVDAGPDSRVSVRFATKDGLHHQVLKVNNRELAGEEFGGYAVKQFDVNIPTADILTKADIKIEGLENSTDRQAVAFIKLTYPRTFDFGNASSYAFSIEASNAVSYLEITNFDSGTGSPVLYDLTNHTLQQTTLEGGVVKIALSASAVDRDLILINSTAAQPVDNVQPLSFIDYTQQDASYIIISNNKLYDDGQGKNWVQEYANYRASEIGGQFSSTVVDVNQLYEQFAYGLSRHPLAVRNFGHFIKDNWSNPRYVFIIGKGREYAFTRKKEELEATINQSFTVPTYGLPGSDNLLLSRDDRGVPVLPIGRIAASTPGDIKKYLDKVSAMEQTQASSDQTKEDKEWLKRILHLSGGSPAEQATIASYLEQMEFVIEGNDFGGEVTTFYKTSSDPVQISTSQEIFDLINNGVSMITFFGHSGVGTFDFNIDNPDNYTNYARYPVIFSLGCYIGNIHTPVVGASERFIFYEDKGAIAFVASTGVGFTGSLYNFYREFYNQLGSSQYGKSIGESVLGVLTRFQNNSGTTRELVQQNTINGDPAIIINAAPGPDYIVDPSSVSFEPSVVTAQQDSFDLIFSVNNIGKNVTDSIVVEIERQTSDGNRSKVVSKKVKAPSYSDQLKYRLSTDGEKGVGLNRLFIKVDTEDEVAELPAPAAEDNNELFDNLGRKGIELYIVDNSARAVYPGDFSIVNKQTIELKASTGDPFATVQKYVFELDTTALFNSPFKQSKQITQSGGLLKWTPQVGLTDETVYYWRVSQDSTISTIGYVWDTRSFLYDAEGENGWNQSHYYQYQNNDYEGIKLNGDRTFDFWENGFFLKLDNRVRTDNNNPFFTYDFGNQAASVQPWLYLNSGIAVVVVDSITGAAWVNNNPDPLYGSVNSGFQRVFAYPTNTFSEREVLMNFLNNDIPSSNYVFLFTVQSSPTEVFNPEEWEQDSLFTGGVNLFNLLEDQGATLVRQLKNNGSVPYAIIYQKDKREVLDEDIASSTEEFITTEGFFPIKRTDGDVFSSLIGPAKSWKSLHWEYNSGSQPDGDSTSLSVIGLDAQFRETTLIENWTNADTTLAFIDATQFPYLKLKWTAKDETLRTSADLKQWKVLFEGIPEVAVDPATYFTFHSDSLEQGDIMSFGTLVENISDYAIDSLLVRFKITDQQNNIITTDQRLKPLSSGDTIAINYSMETRDLEGIQNLLLEINPDKDQPELYQFNNFALKSFQVLTDSRNPNLDVTFDGIHIMNGDIVSSRPDIRVTLQDENRFLHLTDTSLIRMFLQHPNGTVEKISFNSELVEFFPADGSENKASVQFRPQLDVDGTYQLIVQAEDATGNQSGDFDYKSSFEILNKKAISNVLNYPNPFSTSTQFVYTLTGHEPPEYFKIQIMTVSGKIVREITQDETGPLQIGTHKMDYIWDGTDEYGDRLANGVYLYRMVAKGSDGQDYERFDSNTSQYFKNDFGKLVIMR